MNKEEFKEYICNIIDTLDDNEVNNLEAMLCQTKQQDVASELIKINGEFKKLTKVVQNLDEDIKQTYSNQEQEQEQDKQEANNYITLYNFLQNSKNALDELPKLSLFNIISFSEKFGAFKEGFNGIDKLFNQVLEQIELKPTASVNKQFDPQYHEVIETENIKNKDNEIILEVLEQGFIYKNNIIKYAKVKVNKWI